MKNYSNNYIFIFSSAMVAVVATVLSFAAIQLKPLQERNEAVAKQMDILKSVYKAENAENVSKRAEYVQSQYEKYIDSTFVINAEGKLVEDMDAFSVNMKKEIANPRDERNLPVYRCKLDNGEMRYIIPVRGKGLWGPIWGYVSLNEDFNTIYGAVFDHKSETPGLGAEINQDWFQEDFQGKKLYNESGEFVSINVYKGGEGSAENAGDTRHGVDGVSGGTITSNGVQAMIEDCLKPYTSYFNKEKG